MIFSSPKKNIIGLDIGTSSIKLMELEDHKGIYHLKNFGLAFLPRETITNGILKNSTTVVDAIKNLVKNLKVKANNVALSVSGHPVIIKNITLPMMSEVELEDSIQWEAEQYIPFDLDEVNLDFQIFGASKVNPDDMEVLLVAAKKTLISEYIQAIVESGLNPVIIDIDSFALENMYETNYPIENDKIIALIDIGASMININIIQEGASTFTRDVFLGGDHITEELQKELSVSYEEAERLKLGGEIEGVDYDRIENIVKNAYASVAVEIQRSLDFYSSSSDEGVDKLLLSGGACKIPGIEDIVGEKTSIPVELIDPFRQIEINPDAFDPEYIKDIALQATVAIGLAIRKLGDK